MSYPRPRLPLVVPIAAVALAACKPPAGPTDDKPVQLTIATINDFHGALYERSLPDDPGRAWGGLPWLVGAVDALRADDPDLVLIDGGDSFQGDWPVNLSEGMGSAEAFELLKVDVAAIGNHEYDYGAVGDGSAGHPLRGALEAAAAKYPDRWVTANVYEGDQRWSPPGIRPWRIVERKGVKIGVIGITTTETPTTTLLANVADLTFRDPVETVREILPELAAEGVDVVIIAGHLTGKCDPASFTDPGAPCVPEGTEIGRLLTELDVGAVDLIVAGHAHTVLAQRTGDTFLVENRSHGQLVGRVDLVVGADGVMPDASVVHPHWPIAHAPTDPGCTGAAFPLDPIDVGGRTIAPNADAVALIDRLEAGGPDMCEVVGCTDQPLSRSRERESALGDVVADAMLATFPGADLAIQNSGGLRADVVQGEIRLEDVQAVMPFDNRLLLVEISGDKLEELLEIGSSGAHGLLQVAGATYTFAPSVPGGLGVDRLCEATVGDAAIDPSRRYRLVTTDFLFGGGDHLGPAFEGATVVEEGPLLRDAIVAFLRGNEACLAAATPVPDPSRPRIREAPACE